MGTFGLDLKCRFGKQHFTLPKVPFHINQLDKTVRSIALDRDIKLKHIETRLFTNGFVQS
ncbi:hypothetical protein BN874_900002 [Candidatus Contendobacter odensis Run_B_J11]|uniref:Uncharacterized protein n=1 Tax=Candidatus Contendobacter odensis Run_B_J11 TaxID=1400861 RepID=A0A7U7J5S0_9GAMM|nr:hypothetical protein BN874_900002 [Candidatus Contendobacter odensis Run_B_J11]